MMSKLMRRMYGLARKYACKFLKPPSRHEAFTNWYRLSESPVFQSDGEDKCESDSRVGNGMLVETKKHEDGKETVLKG